MSTERETRLGTDAVDWTRTARVALSAAIAAGFLNTGTALALRPDHPLATDWPLMIAVLAAASVVSFVLFVATWLLVARPLAHITRTRPHDLRVVVTVLVVGSTGLGTWLIGNADALASVGLARTATAVVALVAITVVAYTAVAARRQGSRNDSPDAEAWRLVMIACIGGLLGVAWIRAAFKIEVFDDVTGGPSIGAMTTVAVAVVVVAGLSVLAWRHGTGRAADRVTAGLLVSLLLIPALAELAEQLRSTSAQSVERWTDSTENVILITVDTLRRDAVGVFGTDGDHTPNIDALARDSLIFTSARSPASWTKPAMASILTGLSPVVHRTYESDSILQPQLTTLAEQLRDAGYQTTAFVKNPYLGDAFGFGQGFSEFHVFLGTSTGHGAFVGLHVLEWTGMSAGTPDTGQLVDLGIRWLEEDAREPFFLWLHVFDPHAPYAPPIDFLSQPSSVGRLGAEFRETQAVQQGRLELSRQERDWVRTLYDAELRYVDRELGRFLETLEHLDLYRDSLILFASDHGEEFWEHGGLGHGHTMYEELLAVPMLIKRPGTFDSRRIDEPVTTESIMPTVLDLLGIDALPSYPTTGSVAHLWRGQASGSASTPIIGAGTHRGEQQAYVVFEDWKYILSLESGLEELFFLEDDPYERDTRASSRPGPLAEARRLLDEHLTRAEQLAAALGIDEAQTVELDEGTLEDLRALGYIR